MMRGSHSSSRHYGVSLSAGSELNTQVQTYPAGTTFFLPGGTYRLTTPIIPKSNQKFSGSSSNMPILNGAKIITGWTNVSGVWHASLTGFSQSPPLSGTGNCMTGRRCDLPYDVYVDSILYSNLTSNTVVAGTTQSYIDLGTNPPTCYIGTDPTGHTVEVTFTIVCFDAANASSGSGVRLTNLIVEKFATPAQRGTIGGLSDQTSPGTGWTVTNVEARYNHGAGLRVGANFTCSGCHLHHNGQMGYGGGGGTGGQAFGGVLDSSEIDHNNTAGFNAGWEAGGGKFAYSTSYTVSNCNVHDNGSRGPGIWWDVSNYLHSTIGNNCSNNDGPGIMVEISYDGVVSGNTCTNNSAGPLATDGQFGWGSGIGQIFVSSSQNVEINNNTLRSGSDTSTPHGILMVQQNRGTGNRGVWSAANNNFHDNDIKIIGTAMSPVFIGFDFGTDPRATTTFANNHYHLNSTSRSAFDWNGAFTTFANWKLTPYFFDVAGTIDTSQ